MKQALGLAHFEGRTFNGWHHHVTLVSVAHAFCTLQRLARAPKDTAPALSLYRIVRELQTLLATWNGACPTCHRDIPTPAPT